MLEVPPFFPSLVLVVGLAGCGSRELSVPAAEAFPPHFSALRDRILRPRCGACHAKIVQYAEVARDLVKPGDPVGSRLFQEIDEGRMPQYGGKLPAEEITAIRTWIANGAKND